MLIIHKLRKAKADKAEAEMLLGSRRGCKLAAQLHMRSGGLGFKGVRGRILDSVEFASSLGAQTWDFQKKLKTR